MSTPPQKALVESAGLEPSMEQRRGPDRKVPGVGMEPRYAGQQGRERLGGEILGLGIILQTATETALNGLRTHSFAQQRKPAGKIFLASRGTQHTEYTLLGGRVWGRVVPQRQGHGEEQDVC